MDEVETSNDGNTLPLPLGEGRGEGRATTSEVPSGRRKRHTGPMPILIAGLAAVGLTASAFALIRPSASQSPASIAAPDALETFAGIPPVAYLVKRIGGPHVRVEVLVQPGQDPHIFEPTPRQAVRLSEARLFFKIGMPFEDQLAEHVSAGNARIAVVDTAAGIVRRIDNDACESTDGDDEDEGPDPHVWLAPRLLMQMGKNIAAALCRADPSHEPTFRANLATLDAELDALDRRLAANLAPYRGQAFYVFHPAFGYFADAYGLRQESVEVEGKTPTPRQLFRMIQRARADRVKIIFLQPQFNQQAAASIAQALDGAVMPMDSLAYDVVANLDDVAKSVGNALVKPVGSALVKPVGSALRGVPDVTHPRNATEGVPYRSVGTIASANREQHP